MLNVFSFTPCVWRELGCVDFDVEAFYVPASSLKIEHLGGVFTSTDSDLMHLTQTVNL